MCAQLDVNKDGVIDKAEFARAFQKLDTQHQTTDTQHRSADTLSKAAARMQLEAERKRIEARCCGLRLMVMYLTEMLTDSSTPVPSFVSNTAMGHV